CPLKVMVDRGLLARSVIPVLLARSSSKVPLALARPLRSVERRVGMYVVLGVPMVPDATAELSVKLPLATPVTATLNVAWKVTLLALVSWPLGEKRLIEVSVTTLWLRV